jgi:N-acetylglutamate synthase-like GNAT family acetyltransferase
VFVTPNRRRQGAGAALVRRIMDEARSLHVSKLDLYTVDRTTFYSNLGWALLEHTAYRGQDVSIMSYSTITTKP